jgi:hypothetical protein
MVELARHHLLDGQGKEVVAGPALRHYECKRGGPGGANDRTIEAGHFIERGSLWKHDGDPVDADRLARRCGCDGLGATGLTPRFLQIAAECC